MHACKFFLGPIALFAFAAVSAQQSEPQSTDPAAASSPHQRQTTGENPPEAGAPASPEAEAASSPHQREVTGKAGSKASDAIDPATFVNKAAQGGISEVELAKLALGKSSDTNIQAFANKMIQDHGKANEELTAIAERNHIKAPGSLDATHKAMVEKLGLKNGKDFDAAYAQQMMKDHDETIALFEAATGSRNADIAHFAAKTLPTLKQHGAMARTLP